MGGGVFTLGDMVYTWAYKLKALCQIAFQRYIDVHFFIPYYLVKQIPYKVFSMVSLSCNQSPNSPQLHNSLVFPAGGVSDRLNDYINGIGYSVGWHTEPRAFEMLEAKAEIKIWKEIAQDHIICPLLCGDNLDLQTRVHHKQVKPFNHILHRFWHTSTSSLVSAFWGERLASYESNTNIFEKL